jgi:hypothetical protein
MATENGDGAQPCECMSRAVSVDVPQGARPVPLAALPTRPAHLQSPSSHCRGQRQLGHGCLAWVPCLSKWAGPGGLRARLP